MNTLQHVLIIGFVWPEPNSSAAGARTLSLIHLFQSVGWKITFASAAADSEFMFDLTAIGVERVNIELNNKSFDEWIKALQPAIVVFDRFMTEEQFSWRVAENCPHALRILDTSDLHCLRLARQKTFYENRIFTHDDLVIDVAKREIASILRSDISIIISQVEMELLQNYFKVDKALLHYMPFLLDEIEETTIKNWPSFEERINFISIGNFLHEPNWNAVLFLKQEIWPLIRKQLPQAELNVYGAYSSQKVNELHNAKEGFLIMGRAADSKKVMQQSKVCLAPLRFGAGIKGKLTEAMLCGTPSVTTAIGAESMYYNFEWSGIIANDAKTIAAAAIQLYTDKTVWKKSHENGVKIINSLYQKEKLGATLIQHILKIQTNIIQHRLNNFMGAMLLHHTAASTKYMSKWIEVKNKS